MQLHEVALSLKDDLFLDSKGWRFFVLRFFERTANTSPLFPPLGSTHTHPRTNRLTSPLSVYGERGKKHAVCLCHCKSKIFFALKLLSSPLEASFNGVVSSICREVIKVEAKWYVWGLWLFFLPTLTLFNRSCDSVCSKRMSLRKSLETRSCSRLRLFSSRIMSISMKTSWYCVCNDLYRLSIS